MTLPALQDSHNAPPNGAQAFDLDQFRKEMASADCYAGLRHLYFDIERADLTPAEKSQLVTDLDARLCEINRAAIGNMKPRWNTALAERKME